MQAAAAHALRPRAPPFVEPPGYARQRPENTLLYQLVEQHYPAFRESVPDRVAARSAGAAGAGSGRGRADWRGGQGLSAPSSGSPQGPFGEVDKTALPGWFEIPIRTT